MILLYWYDRCCRQATFIRRCQNKMYGSGASECRLIDDVIILYNPVLNCTPGFDSVQHQSTGAKVLLYVLLGP